MQESLVIFHPRLNEHGKPEPIRQPHVPAEAAAWLNAEALATVVPAGDMPAMLNGIGIATWQSAPATSAAWEALAAHMVFAEPDFVLPPGIHKAAAGAVILEPDGRVWLVSPTNRFGGYLNTFAKGTCEAGMSLRATALKEVYEESGLQIELRDFLVDVNRTTSRCRFYLARRIGGNPADMGWESQAVHLVPQTELASFAAHEKDSPVVAALCRYLQA
jgi:ADP-ribose pyrophosphatase YjhB (NUDIX family)